MAKKRKLSKKTREMIDEVAKFYNLPKKSPDRSDPKLLDRITEEAMSKANEENEEIDRSLGFLVG